MLENVLRIKRKMTKLWSPISSPVHPNYNKRSFWQGDPNIEALSKKLEDAFFACNGLFESFKSTNGIFRIHKCLVGFPEQDTIQMSHWCHRTDVLGKMMTSSGPNLAVLTQKVEDEFVLAQMVKLEWWSPF